MGEGGNVNAAMAVQSIDARVSEEGPEADPVIEWLLVLLSYQTAPRWGQRQSIISDYRITDLRQSVHYGLVAGHMPQKNPAMTA